MATFIICSDFGALGKKKKKKKKKSNNRMGKTSDLFKKIRDTKGTFHAKIGTIKGTNPMDITEADY